MGEWGGYGAAHKEMSFQRLGLGRSTELLRSVPMACSVEDSWGGGLNWNFSEGGGRFPSWEGAQKAVMVVTCSLPGSTEAAPEQDQETLEEETPTLCPLQSQSRLQAQLSLKIQMWNHLQHLRNSPLHL